MTIRDLLILRAKDGVQKNLYLYDADVTMTYRELYVHASEVANSYIEAGVKKGDLILIQSVEPLYTFMGFWGAILVGAIPALYPIGQDMKQHIPAITSLCQDFDINYIYSDMELGAVLKQSMKQQVIIPKEYEKISEDQAVDYECFDKTPISDDDTAVLQFSSGSTGNPKGVLLSNKNIIADAIASAERIGLKAEHNVLNWLPLSHDFAILAMHIIPLEYGCNQMCMKPTTFLRKPSVWAKVVSERKIGFSPLPNFAMNLIVKTFNKEEYKDYDLSSLRAAISAGEGVSVASCDMFWKVLAPYGLKESAIIPAYGLAEATVAVTLVSPEDQKNSYYVAPDAVIGDAIQGKEKKPGSRLIIGCGRPIDCNKVYICDDDYNVLEEGHVGNIMISGDNVTKGYYNNPDATKAILRPNGDLDTGDIGFLYDGELFISGRRKEMIIINGRNYFSSDIEAAVRRVVKPFAERTVAAFAVHDSETDTEKLYVAVESTDITEEELAKDVRNAVLAALHIPCQKVVFLPEIPKTASGKVRYYMLTRQFEDEFSKNLPGKEGTRTTVTSSVVADRDSITPLVYSALSTVTAYPVASLHDEDNLQVDLGIDSIMMAELVADLSSTFGFNDEQIQNLITSATQEGTTIADLVGFIEKAGGKITTETTVNTEIKKDNQRRDADKTTEVVMQTKISDFDEYKAIHTRLKNLPTNPYYKVNYGVPRDKISTDDGDKINYSTYNYVGLNGNKDVMEAAQKAVARYGTSVSGSRMISGEIDLHRQLENAITEYLGTEDTIVYIGGYTTNVSAISTVVSSEDLILHDSLSHNSIVTGCRLSGAKRMSFKHNDMDSLEDALKRVRKYYRRVLIVVEGIYSMDGDICDLPRIIELKKEYGAILMVDEAHSLGTIGDHGRGVGSYYNVDRRDVDLWMGTMSKSLASCGGYISGSKEIVELLKYTSDGFMFSVGISPANAAAALEALNQLKTRPELVEKLDHNSRFFLNAMKEKGLDTGLAQGTAVVPCIIGDSNKCMELSQKMFKEGVNVMPIVYPAVPEEESRLRFFISSEHTEEEMSYTVDVLSRLLNS